MACFPLNPASDTAVNQDRRPTRSHSGRYNEHPVRLQWSVAANV